jgi:hypothetical protein
MKKLLLIGLFAMGATWLNAQVVFNVLAPANVQGAYDLTYVGPPTWGGDSLELPENSITGELVIARDSTIGDTIMCFAAINGDEIAGKIAVLWRRDCEFGVKALNAENAGAIGVVILNETGDRAGPPVGMGGGEFGIEVTIPVVMLSTNDGITLRPAILEGGVTVFIGNKVGLFGDDVGITSNDVLRAEQYSTPRALAQNATEFSVELGAGIINYGTNDQSDVTLNAKITLNGDVIYDETTETPVDMASGDTSFFDLPDFSQGSYASGRYQLNYSSNISAEDEFPSDNELNADFMVSDSIYSYGSVRPDGEPNNVTFFSGDNISPGTEASICIAFTDPHASRMVVEGLTFSASVGSELDPDGITGVLVDVYAYEWEDEFADADDPNFGIASDGSSLNQLALGSYEYPENLENVNIYVPFGQVVTLEDDLRYLFCMSYTQEFMFPGHDARTMDYTKNFDTFRQPINVQEGENDAGWSTFGIDSSFSLIPAITVSMKDPLYDAINEEAKRVEITPFPNPTANEINIPVGSNYGQTLIDVYDIAGKKVKSINVTTSSFEVLKVNVSDLDNGAYIFRMNFGDGSYSNFNVVVNN